MASTNVTLIPIIPRGKLLDRTAVLAALKAAVTDTQAEGQRLMATYPPPGADQVYVRTGTLKRSWNYQPVVMSGGRIVGVIGSSGAIAPYNEDVQGETQRAFFGARGWKKVDDLVALVRKQLPLRAQAAIDRAAGARQ